MRRKINVCYANTVVKVNSFNHLYLNLLLSISPAQIYALWGQIRENKLQDELNRVDRHNRLDKIDSMLQEMTEEEEKLWFFENETKIDLEIEKISTDHEKKEKISRRQQKIIDDAYIPPEVSRSRN